MIFDSAPAAPETTAAPAAPGAPAPAVPAPAAPEGGNPAPAAPAPTQPAAPAPAPAEPTPSAKPEVPEVDDPGLALALEFVVERGIPLDDPVMEAARSGDFSLLEAKLASLGPKAAGYDKFLGLAKQAYERHMEKVEKTNSEVESIVHGVCGGKEQWTAIQAWASKEATQQEKDSINAAFAAGGVQARMAALYLAQAYQRANAQGYQEPAPAARRDAGAGASANTTPLTAKEYAAKVDALWRENRGRDITNLPEYRALQTARLAAKRAGF